MLLCSSLPQLLWNYKLNLTTDPKFESVATEVCKSTIAEVSVQCRQHTGSNFLSSLMDLVTDLVQCELDTVTVFFTVLVINICTVYLLKLHMSLMKITVRIITETNFVLLVKYSLSL